MVIPLYQILIFTTLILVRIFAKKYLEVACLVWTALTLINLLWPPLIVLQLIVVWGTYGVIRPKKPPKLAAEARRVSVGQREQQAKQTAQQMNDSALSSVVADTRAHAGEPCNFLRVLGGAPSSSNRSRAERTDGQGRLAPEHEPPSVERGSTRNVVVETKRERVVVPKPRATADAMHAADVSIVRTSGGGGVTRPAALIDSEIERQLKALRAAEAIPKGLSDAAVRRRLKALQATRKREADERTEREAMEKARLKAEEERRVAERERVRAAAERERSGRRYAEIRALVEEFGIPHLVHFTRCENLPSIWRHGLRSIASCDAEGIQAIRNDKMRLDGKPDAISLSITFPNYRMFYKYRQLNVTADWAVLILSPKILWEKECGFYKHNAADSRMRNRSRELVATAQAFREMFETPDLPRESWLCRYDPTDPQAEVMVYEPIEPTLIDAVAFETRHIVEKWAHVLGGVETIYAGQGKGLFASRAQVRLN